MKKENILIIGANGQLGTALTKKLIQLKGESSIFATDIIEKPGKEFNISILNALNLKDILSFVEENEINQIYHLAAVLSASGEKDPINSWNINMQSLLNVLEAGRIKNIEKVFFPSSIAVFSNNNQKDLTPQNSILEPSTVYGISKAVGENWLKYYFERYGLDTRSIRYPGIIGYDAPPGGGTTDYAVEIYHKAVKNENFECCIQENTALPMLFMDDAVNAAIQLMETKKEKITIRTSYNIGGFSLKPTDFEASLKTIFPNFKVTYSPDFRQEIAAAWPSSLEEDKARKDWGWEAKFDLNKITKIMVEKLQEQYYAIK